VIEQGRLADVVVPDRDYFACAESEIADTTALLTVMGGKVVYGAGEFAPWDDSRPPVPMPNLVTRPPLWWLCAGRREGEPCRALCVGRRLRAARVGAVAKCMGTTMSPRSAGPSRLRT